MKPTIERLCELFTMDENGRLFRRVPCRRVRPGVEAGGAKGFGYRSVFVDGRDYYCHLVVFALANGRWSAHQVDHINGVRSDNRPENLREATSRQNNQNSGMKKSNKSGYKGVHWETRSGRWVARIRTATKRYHLGSFPDAEMAGLAYAVAAERFNGEFAKW